MFDAIDSGLSINNIVDVKEYLFKPIMEDCAKNNIEVLGINLGTVGFMSEIEISEISLIEKRNEAERKRMEEMLAKQQADNSDDSEQ